MEVARLYEYACSDNGPHGPDTIFTEDQVGGIVALLGEVRDRACPTSPLPDPALESARGPGQTVRRGFVYLPAFGFAWTQETHCPWLLNP